MYQNQMYQNPYSNYTQPNYMQQIQPIQQMQQAQPQNAGIIGRFVNGVDEINVGEVPMNTVSVFPKKDMSEIYVKSWNGDGTIQTIVYQPMNNSGVAVKQPTITEQIQSFRDEIMQRFDELEKPAKATTSSRSKAKKEVVEDE